MFETQSPGKDADSAKDYETLKIDAQTGVAITN